MQANAPTVTIAAALADAARRIDAFDARELLRHLLQKEHAWLIAHDREPLHPDHWAAFQALVTRRASGEPLAYVTGQRGFWSLDLTVTPDTLIPRAETELLVKLALQHLPATAGDVLDLGTGSGAVALAIARELPAMRVVAVDASAAALAVARANAARNGVANVEFLQGDWFAPVAGRRFDAIVSNPPYIVDDDPHLQRGDLRFEPMLALSSGADGMDAIRHITTRAAAHLHDGAWLLLEHGWEQGALVRETLRAAGLTDVGTRRDLENRERVSLGRAAHGA